jgi:hypothetical protein
LSEGEKRKGREVRGGGKTGGRRERGRPQSMTGFKEEGRVEEKGSKQFSVNPAALWQESALIFAG